MMDLDFIMLYNIYHTFVIIYVYFQNESKVSLPALFYVGVLKLFLNLKEAV